MFMGQDDESASPIMAVRVHKRRWTEAIPARRKRPNDQHGVQAVVNLVKRMGLTKLTFKSDQEPSITSLKGAVVGRLGGDYSVAKEETPVEEHQSNGTIERAVDSIAGIVRTQKLALEKNYGVDLSWDHAVLPWLIGYSGTALSLFEVGSDGCTAYERVKGKTYRRELPSFGASVCYLPADRKRGHLNKVQAKWLSGIYLGPMVASGELFVGTKDGVLKARSVKRRPKTDRHDKAMLDAMRGEPLKPVPLLEAGAEVPPPLNYKIEKTLKGEPLDVDKPEENKPGGPRRVYIRANIEIEKFGMTLGCAGCDAVRKGAPPRSHNEECRKRVMKEMAADEALNKRLRAAEKREAKAVKRTAGVPERPDEPRLKARRTEAGSAGDSGGRHGVKRPEEVALKERASSSSTSSSGGGVSMET